MDAVSQGNWTIEPFGLGDWPTARRLLLRCYPCTAPALWDQGIERLKRVPSSTRDEPIGVLLQGQQGVRREHRGQQGGCPLGLAFLLPSQRPGADGSVRRHVNGSSWAIVPAARERALWMARQSLSEPATLYTALTPIPATVRVIERLGFEALTHQLVLAATPKLAWMAARGARQPPVLAGAAALQALRDDPLAAALHDHARLGCEVLALQHGSGVQGWVPLVFRPQRRLRLLPTAELVYAPSQALVARHAPALSACLLRRGHLLLAFDAHQDLAPGIPCTRLFQRRFARGAGRSGPATPVDHLYSELVYLHC